MMIVDNIYIKTNLDYALSLTLSKDADSRVAYLASLDISAYLAHLATLKAYNTRPKIPSGLAWEDAGETASTTSINK